MKSASYIKIALFFIVLGGAGIGYIVLSGSGMGSFNTHTYETVLSDASGLSTRSRIYLAGVPVGQVQSISLVGNEARLTVVFLRDIEIRQDALISRQASSLLGTSVLNLNPGTEFSPIISPGSRINSTPPGGGIDQAMDMLQEVGGNVNLILEEFRTNQLALLAVSLETFNSITRKIDDQSDVQLDRISRILESTALITERTERLLRGGEQDISSSLSDMHMSMANIRAITEEISAGRGNLGQVLFDDSLYRSFLTAAERTEDAAGKLGETLDNISGLARTADGVVSNAGEIVERALGLGIQVDSSARYDVLAQSMRASASIRLDPRSNDRWYRVGVSSVPDGIVSRTVRETTDGSGIVSWEDTVETRYNLGLDVELARKIGMFTLRGGLLENTAGIGIDLQPINRIRISGEIFNFRAGNTPNLRSTLTVYPFFDPDSDLPWNWLYLRGGITNALSGNRDFFFGGGLRFADREVKGLVGLVPVFN